MENKSSADIQKALQEMFLPEDIEWRVQQAGVSSNNKPWVMAIPYITSRAVQKRLDDVMGFGNWKNEFKEVYGGMLCGLSLLIDGNWITKWDGAPINDSHPVKGVISDATKRSAIQWGIGRYLYQLDVEFAICEMVNCRRDATSNYHPIKEGKTVKWHINWQTPPLPAWAVPHKDLNPFLNPMKEAETMQELADAFSMAYKYSKAQGDDDLEEQFINCKNTNKERIQKGLGETAKKQFEAIKVFIDKQIKMFAQLPTKSTVDNNFELAKKSLSEECKGKIFKHENAFELLEAGYNARIEQLNKAAKAAKNKSNSQPKS